MLLQHTPDRTVTGVGTNSELPLSTRNVQLHGIQQFFLQLSRMPDHLRRPV